MAIHTDATHRTTAWHPRCYYNFFINESVGETQWLILPSFPAIVSLFKNGKTSQAAYKSKKVSRFRSEVSYANYTTGFAIYNNLMILQFQF